MMITLSWPEWIDNLLWAKSAETGKDGRAESLARHTWYVLETLAASIRLRPDLPKNIGFPCLWNSLFWACFLHDFGKAAQGFQERLRGGKKWPHRHELLSLAFIDWVKDALSEEEYQWVSAAIVSHHKDANEIQSMYLDPIDPEDDPLILLVSDISYEAMSGLWRWLNECSSSWVAALGLSDKDVRIPVLPQQSEAIKNVQEQGALRVRKLLQNFRGWLRTLNRSSEWNLIIGTLALRGHLISSDHMASAHINEFPISLISSPGDLLTRLGIRENMLYPHQRECAVKQGSVVLVAPTGSGKTESALLWACAQSIGKHPVPRLFYTLPYQASMNAMYERLNKKAFPKQVGLEHSRSVLAIYRHWLSEEYTPQQASRAARWSKNLSRLNYFPVRVLSPYQILKAPYRLKGYEMLLCDFFDATFVLDEIHAYDPGRLSMILCTVKYLREQFRTRFFLMSATLSRLLLSKLTEVLGEYTIIQATPELFTQFCRHKLHLIDGDLLTERWMEQIAETAKKGLSVLVCCNTVKRAQHFYTEIKKIMKDNINIVLLHGRFNGKDRLERERIVQISTGSMSMERQPIVLIATQVIEVSLDIDLDLIYTDPAPLEALIQRFGRINRRRKKKNAPVYVFTEPSDGQGIYSDDLVKAALKVLTKNSDNMINEACISEWLDEIYVGLIADQWNQKYEQSYNDFESACISALRAFNSDSILEQAFYQAFDSIEVLPECFENTYRMFIEKDEPLEASQLLVSLQWQQYWKLSCDGRVRDDDRQNWPKVVDVAYSELGLEV